MAFVQVNGVELYYEQHGPPDGDPLLLMHGGAGSLADAEAGWTQLIPLLSKQYRVLAVEHRGHGRSGAGDGLGYEQITADIRLFLRALELPPVHFGGVSDGGITGLHLARAEPGLLRSMVCVGTNYRVDDAIRGFLRENFTPEIIEAKHPGWAADLARRHDPHHFPGYWRTLVRQVYEMASTSPDFAPQDLAAITTPTLLVSGERDPFASTDQMYAMKRAIPGAEWLTVNDAWHIVQHTHASVVGPRIADFYARH